MKLLILYVYEQTWVLDHILRKDTIILDIICTLVFQIVYESRIDVHILKQISDICINQWTEKLASMLQKNFFFSLN